MDKDVLGVLFGSPQVEEPVPTQQKRCSVFISYKEISDLGYYCKDKDYVGSHVFPPGTYTNKDVEVVVIKLDQLDYMYWKPKVSFQDLVAQNSFLAGKNITDIYVYVGKITFGKYSMDADKVNLMNVMINLAYYYAKRKTVIHIVGCRSDYDRKRLLAKQNGFDFISCQCGGYDDMARIIKLLLKKDINLVFCEKCRRFLQEKSVRVYRYWEEEKEGKKFKFTEFKCKCSDDKRIFSLEID